MSIASEITRLSGVRGDIFTSITNKGVTVPVGSTFSSCPSLIDQIQGGGGGPATSLINSGFTASAFWSAYMPFTATQNTIAIPYYDEWEAMSGAAFQNQQSYFTIFELKDKLKVMSIKYDVYNIPSYFILTMSASASRPDNQLDNLYGQFMNTNFFNNPPLCLVGNNQNSYITTANYSSNKQGIREVDPNQPYAPTAVYLSAIVDLSPILTNPLIFDQNQPSASQYGEGFSISFNGTNEINQFKQWISQQWGGSIVSSMSGCLSNTTAYPYPNYDPTTTGYITNEISGIEKWDNGKAVLSSDSFKNVNYYSSPSITSIYSQTSSYVDTFSSNMLKNYTQSKINNAGNDFNYTYSYGTTQMAYSGFEGI